MKKKNIIGKKIKEARIERRLTQKELGKALRLSDKTISSYEIGRTTPGFEILKKISQSVQKSIVYFDEDAPQAELDLQEKLQIVARELAEIKKLLKKTKRLKGKR